MSDLTALLDTRDCATPGCPNEADREDGLCGYCRTNTRPTRAALAGQVRELRAQGLTHQQVADQLGISRSYAAELTNDPDGSKARARKESYAGVCEACGAPTTGSNGHANAPRLCRHCTPGRGLRVWTPETVVAAIQEWAGRHGRPPTAAEWIRRTVDPDGHVFPPYSAVYGAGSKPFARWADAIEAAGFPRPHKGTRRKQMQTNGTKPRMTRPYLVFRQDDDGTLSLVGETDAATNQEAIETLADQPGRYASVAKGSLQVFTLAPRLVAARAALDEQAA